MSYNYYDQDAPPRRQQSQVIKIRGRVSTAYDTSTPALSVQEPTPELIQGTFSTSPPQITSAPQSFKGKEPLQQSVFNKTVFSPTTSRPVTPLSEPFSFEETTPRQSVNRRTSIPIRGIHVRSPTLPKVITVHCDQCKSEHKISISETDRASIVTCNAIQPVNPPPQPTILEVFNLPGYLSMNDSGQILVKTESELLSYVRKIFAPMKGFNGYFPKNRRYNIDYDDELPDTTSNTSTPDETRASYYLGHSKYHGTFLNSSEDTSHAPSTSGTQAPPSPIARAQSPEGPIPVSTILDPTPAPTVNRDNKPQPISCNRDRSISPMAFVRTITPTGSKPRSPVSPQHASASRRSSPRNLRPIDIFSETESEAELPSHPSQPTEKEVLEPYMPRSALSPSPGYNTRTVMPSEIYNIHDEISQELNAEPRSRQRSSSTNSTPQSPHDTRGRDSRRR